jgi:aspartate kinase
MSENIVAKFGGTSVATANAAGMVKKIIDSDDENRRYIVVSAPGKLDEKEYLNEKYREKVTDLLIELGKKPDDETIKDRIIQRYQSLSPGTDVTELSDLLNQRRAMPKDNPKRYADGIKAFGEEACARLLAKVWGLAYIDPKELFVVSEEYGNARILPQSEEMVRKRLAGIDGKIIIPGFYGYTEKGSIATLSRGGSDLTGAYVAAAVGAKTYENFTDVDGICAANPNLVNNPKTIRFLTFEELRDLTYSGFNVFHDEAVQPVQEKQIPVHVRNTFSFPKTGTFICYERRSNPQKPIVGIAYKNGFCAFDIAAFGLNSMRGIERKILQTFEEEGVSVECSIGGIDDVSVIFAEDQILSEDDPEGCFKINMLNNRLKGLLANKNPKINFNENYGILVVAGKGIKESEYIQTKVSTTLSDAGVKIKFISQGPSERCIIYGINSADSSKAVNAIYDKFLK